MWSPDTSGVTLTKPSPRLASAYLPTYQDAADWVRQRLERYGYSAASARLDPYQEVWSFYDADGDILARVPHAVIERIDQALRRGWLECTADAASTPDAA